jgi:fluoride exporter
VDAWASRRAATGVPWGTLTVNVSGSCGAGLVAGLVAFAGAPGAIQVVAGIGFMGSFTTFSTFAVETVRLAEEGALAGAVRNVAGNLFASWVAAAVGFGLVGIVA